MDPLGLYNLYQLLYDVWLMIHMEHHQLILLAVEI